MSSGKRFEKTFARKKKDTPGTTITNGVTNRNGEHLQPTTTHHQPNGQSDKKTNSSGTNSKVPVLKKGEQSTATNNNNNNHNKSASKTNKENNNSNNKDNGKKKKKDANGLQKLKQRILNEDKDETQNHKRKLENGVHEIHNNGALKKDNKKSKIPKILRDDKDETSECAFPTNRILRIAKSSEGYSDCKLSGEAVFLINKATEKFIELFSNDAYHSACEDHKSFVAYKHLASAVCKKNSFDFLADCVPEKVTAEKALSERKPADTLIS